MSQKPFVQLKLGSKTFRATGVSTEGCQDVDEFIEEIQKKFSPDLDGIPAHRITLFQPDGTTEINPETTIEELLITKGKPLIVKVEENPSQRRVNTNSGKRKRKRPKYQLDIDAVRSGTVVGSGATGQVIRLKDSNIVVKCCDSHNNPDGFKMLQNEISIYEKLSEHNLNYVPRYYGECEFYGQYFLALEYIPGKHCDWRADSELKEKLDVIIRDLKSVAGVVHQDLRPENVLLTPEGDIKLIDFGKAVIQ